MTKNNRRDTESGIEQPTNDTAAGQIARLPGVRDLPVVGAGRPQSAEDHIPLQDAVRSEYAIRRDDGTYIGLIEIEPANMATVDNDTWREQVENLSSVLMSNTDGCIQIYSPMRSVDYSDRHETYREEAQERQLTSETASSDILSDIADERADNVSVYDQTTLSRTHYVVVSVGELDTAAQFTEDRGGLATVPVLGGLVKQREQSQTDADAHARAMCEKLTSRVDRLASALRGMEGVSATALSSTKATQVIADHYGREDAFAYDDYASLVRQAPLVYGDEDDPEYPITHEHEYAGRDGTGERAVADGGARAQYQPGVASPSRTVADVVSDEPDALSDHYKSLLAAKFDTSNPGHVRIDNRTLTSTVVVRNWPRVPTYGMFSHILASSNPGVELMLSVHAERDESDDMDQKVLSLEQKWKKAEEKESFTRDRDRQKYETAKDINETRKAPNKAMFEVAAYITVKSDAASAPDDIDPVEWHNDTVASVKRKLQEKPANAGGVRVDHNQMGGLHSSAPIAKDVTGETALMKDMGLASVYPWHARNLTDPNGVVVGRHRERDEPTVLDIFNRETGYNMGIFGTLGAGKSMTLKELLTRHRIRNPQTTVAIIEPLREFHGLTKLFDGERIVIGGDTPINPFHIEPTPADVLHEVGAEVPFKTAMRQSKSFIETYYQLEGIDYESRKGTWELAIKLAYEWAGITNDPRTHDRPSPTVETAIWFIRDMINNPGQYIDEAVEDNEKAKKHREETAIKIVNDDIEPFKEGGEYHNLTKPTDLDIEDGDFVYLDLHQYENDHETGGLMMQLLISQIYEQTKQSDHPTVTAFDEARYMFSNSADLGFLKQIVRHSRHYDLSMIFSTQQMGDFFEEREDEDREVLKESAKDILDNTSMKIFHYLKEMDNTWADAFDLTDAEQAYVKDAEPGEREIGYSEALLQVDREGCFPLRVEMDEDTNPREFATYRYDPTKHGEDMAGFLRQHDDVCNWRWTKESPFHSSEPQSQRSETVTETPRAETETTTITVNTRGAESDVDAESGAEGQESPSPPEPASADESGEETGEIGSQPGGEAGIEAAVNGGEQPDESVGSEVGRRGLLNRVKGGVTSAFAHPSAGKPQPEFADMSMVDERKTAALRNAGFETVADVYTADKSEIAAVAGIDNTNAGYIQKQAEQALDASDASMPAPVAERDESGIEDSSPAESHDGDDDGTDHRALTAIQQVGEDRADMLREEGFGSVADVAHADQRALTDVEGIGETRAAQITTSANGLIAEQSDGAVAADGGAANE